MPRHKIAVIAGDGIGKEVVPEGIRVLEAAGRKFGFEFQWDELPWSCDYYLQHGRMMPDDGLDRIRGDDAIFGRRRHARHRRSGEHARGRQGDRRGPLIRNYGVESGSGTSI
jgi:isocitrate/isopropylmalate dehydrogenase